MTNRVLLCVGEMADKPFYFDKIYTNLYSIEELCFVLHENAFMLDKDIVSRELADWIGVECKLPELARELYPMINQSASAGAFVGRILEYVGYYPEDEIKKTETILNDNVSMSVFERWKAKADFLLENGHYSMALREYDYVLSRINEDDLVLKSRIYNNMGITYMILKLYDFAEECFKMAFTLTDNVEAYGHYLKCKRFHLTDDEYIRFVADEQANHEVSVAIESDMLRLSEAYEASDRAGELRDLFALKNSSDAQVYYDRINEMTSALKERYRESVKDSIWRNS